MPGNSGRLPDLLEQCLHGEFYPTYDVGSIEEREALKFGKKFPTMPSVEDVVLLCFSQSITTAALSTSTRLGMTTKTAISPNSPLPGFVHKTLANGLTISTCLLCKKSIGSPTPASLRMAE